ncbi:MAG: hypothetical protein UU16_C0003G0015 [Candidatus Woesebacteria bacterium GW2011_GWA2_40_7]|uniref:Pyridoxamine 5'-phosphate oxidase N-terminal domain-containing protein n=3 Tax=Candidatus Woeseibacteriota TaxID=1752722 RepID=A0A0G0UV80_9BACT|nr:MAG: hypothetical protein UT17_C0002G0020 [Candidatus Woesebacteria bacterium GW2011_GWB1_39_10]KKR74254.1 MAG: hypothetical protein UU16_C0003G0015 [Candidatus Woesebacteria bacterium GW2011_GWA2_40_7]KKR92629.1 MAG: hypothetical protein UU42_C0001G0233 [Candidatus Woesebacteria bacterium GW2011_GWA1_41_13b]
METKVLDFLDKQRVCCLTTLLEDGSPHASAMHFSHSNEPLEIYIQTENTSRKCQALLSGKDIKASIVIGFSEEEFKTLQMDGNIKIVNPENLNDIHQIHYYKLPDAKKWKDDPATIFLVFKPTWWRYTEYKPEFKVISSEE